MKRSILTMVLVAVIVAMGATVAAAADVPYDTNSECLECHGVAGSASSTTDFSVPAVDYTACRRCHAAIESTYLHEHSANCAGANCHVYGNVIPPSYYSAYGRFQSPASLAASAQQLHAKHVNAPRMDLTWGVSGCQRCHAPMTCDACHVDQGVHGPHAQSSYGAVTYANTNGLTYASRAISCVNTACHGLAQAGSASFIPTCLSCHTEKSVAHGGDHSYTSASDYDETTQSGCSNSGAGCHGSDPDYADMRAQYGHLGCLAGPCHTSVSKPAETAPLDCLNCHDGSYVGAPDRMVLTAEKPHGHLDSALHSAGAMDRLVTSGGSASAACTQCHGPVLPGAHASISSVSYGTALGCAECHNDVSSGGMSEVAASWPTRTCEACHGIASGSPMHSPTHAPVVSAESDGCGASGTGCHPTDDLHGLHKDASGCALSGCHDGPGSPTSTSCGGVESNCHVGYVATHYGAQEHTAAGDIDGAFAGVDCAQCHAALLPDAHSDTAAATCGGCHSSVLSAPVIGSATPWAGDCGACHLTVHDTFAEHVGRPVTGNTCLGAGCHPNDSTSLVTVHSGLASGCTLAGCHDTRNANRRPTKMTCGTGGDCHDGKIDGNHGGDHSYTSASDYVDATQSGCTNSGAGCHGTDLTYADMRSQYGHTGCTNGPCHTSASKPDVVAPLDCVKCHAGAYAGAPDAFALTDPAPVGHYPEGLHTSPNGIMTTRYVSAGGTASAACIVCHDRTLPVAHGTIGSAAYGTKLSCAECHNDLGTGGLLQVRADWSNKMCEDCHSVGSAAPAHGSSPPVVSGESPAGCAGSGAGCHAVDLHAIHADASSCMLGCHTKDAGAVQKTCGAADSGCHKYYDSGHYEEFAHTAAGDIDGSETVSCVTCHSKPLGQAHANTQASACSGCHGDPLANGVVEAGWDRNCGACHLFRHEGLPNHAGRPVAGQSCLGSGCHPNDATSLMDVHSSVPGSCSIAGCHDAGNIDQRPTKTSCGTGGDCHDGKLDGNHGGDHSYTAASDYGLVAETGCTNSGDGCHGSDLSRDIRTYHASSGCQDGACHDQDQDEAITPPDECAACHSGNYRNAPDVVALTDPAPAGHYGVATHTATSMGRVLTAGGTASATCTVCHDAGLLDAHSPISVTGSPYGSAVSCYECHNDTRSNGFSEVLANWRTDTCDDCHNATATAPMHQNPPAVVANTTAGCTTGSGCHATELHALHRNAQSCVLSGCHVTKNTAPNARSCGAGGTCHTGLSGSHKEDHDTTGVADAGCQGCHFRYLDDEHTALGKTCDTCHASADPRVNAAIAADDRRCSACHPDAAHVARQATEFSAGNASMHRVRSDLPGMRSSFVVSGATYSWSLPPASSFLKSGYTTSSMVLCSDCHAYSGAAGPHGSTMKVNIDPAYPTDYNALGGESATVQLSNSSPTGMSKTKNGSSAAGVICEKCHDLLVGSSFSNAVHKEHDDRGSDGAYCIHCHTAIPHGLGRPRMLAYTTDAAPYRTPTGGLQRVSVKSYTPSSWSKSDCGAGCSSGRHPLSGTSWPNQMVAPPSTTGAISGKITASSGGAAISGATVTLSSGATASSASDGKYSFAGVSPGAYTLSVSKAGYVTWSGPVNVSAGSTTTQDVTLAPQPTPVNLALGGSASASSVYSTTYGASKAIDGSSSSYWRSSSGGTQWLRVDLGSAKSVSRVVVNWGSYYYARAYRVETSVDGSNWTSQYSTSSGSSGAKSHSFSATNARYVRIYCTSANSSSYRVNEFEVWDF